LGTLIICIGFEKIVLWCDRVNFKTWMEIVESFLKLLLINHYGFGMSSSTCLKVAMISMSLVFIDFIKGDATNFISTIQTKDLRLGQCGCTFLINIDLIKHICASKGMNMN